MDSKTPTIPQAPGLTRVDLSEPEIRAFYDRFSNQFLYSALRGDTAKPILAGDWEKYCAVNARYADAVLRELRAGDLVWVHDYHLMLVPRLVRKAEPSARISFFFHVPFASAEQFMQVRFASELLDGVLGADGIELETGECASSFLAAVASTHAYQTRSSVIEDAGRFVCVYARSASRGAVWQHRCRRAAG